MSTETKDTTYLTIRDLDRKGSKTGRFFINKHDKATGEVIGDEVNANFHIGWGQHVYRQKRQARRAARRIATKLGIDYRQDKEYTSYYRANQIVTAPVTV